MPYLLWVWAMVLFTCLMFTMLDERRVRGVPQAVYAIALGAVLLLRGSEKGSAGSFAIWVLGVGGLALYWVLRLVREQGAGPEW